MHQQCVSKLKCHLTVLTDQVKLFCPYLILKLSRWLLENCSFELKYPLPPQKKKNVTRVILN